MIALSYGITYIWGTVGIILISKYLPSWWGVDAKAAAKKYEEEFGVRDIEGGGLTGYRPFGLRAYRLENAAQVGKTIARAFARHIPNIASSTSCAAASSWAPSRDLVAAKGRRHRAGRRDRSTDRQDGPDRPGGLRSPRRSTFRSIRPKSSSPTRSMSARTLESFRGEAFAGQLQVVQLERGGVPFPAGLKTKLQRMDVITVVGLKEAVNELGGDVGARSRAPTPRPTC